MNEAASPSASPQVDPRLLQANERTLLAWLRTGIALLAFGFVVARMGLWLRWMNPGQEVHTEGAAVIGGAFVLLGVLGNGLAVQRYAAVRVALLRGEGLPVNDRMPIVFGTAVTLLGALVGAYLVLRV